MPHSLQYDEYEKYAADDYDYIEDEEDENALWDDTEKDTAEGDLPQKTRRKRKKKSVFVDSDTDESKVELTEIIQRQIAKEQQLIDELEADAAEQSIEDDDGEEEQPERKLLKR